MGNRQEHEASENLGLLLASTQNLLEASTLRVARETTPEAMLGYQEARAKYHDVYLGIVADLVENPPYITEVTSFMEDQAKLRGRSLATISRKLKLTAPVLHPNLRREIDNTFHSYLDDGIEPQLAMLKTAQRILELQAAAEATSLLDGRTAQESLAQRTLALTLSIGNVATSWVTGPIYVAASELRSRLRPKK